MMIALLVVNEGVSGFHLGNNTVIQFSYTQKIYTIPRYVLTNQCEYFNLLISTLFYLGTEEVK